MTREQRLKALRRRLGVLRGPNGTQNQIAHRHLGRLARRLLEARAAMAAFVGLVDRGSPEARPGSPAETVFLKEMDMVLWRLGLAFRQLVECWDRAVVTSGRYTQTARAASGELSWARMAEHAQRRLSFIARSEYGSYHALIDPKVAETVQSLSLVGDLSHVYADLRHMLAAVDLLSAGASGFSRRVVEEMVGFGVVETFRGHTWEHLRCLSGAVAWWAGPPDFQLLYARVGARRGRTAPAGENVPRGSGRRGSRRKWRTK